MNTKTFKLIGILTVIALFASMVVGTAAFAQGPSTEGTFEDSSGQVAPPNENRGERPPKLEGMREAVDAAVAQVLGLSVEELEAAKEAGTRLPELAESLGVDMADVEAAKQAAKQAVVDQAVADGTITQEQAETILSHDGKRGCGERGRGGQRGNRTQNQESSGFSIGGFNFGSFSFGNG